MEIETPLLEEPLHGSLYLASPMTTRPTGQLTAFDDNPQVPFETFKLNFSGRLPGPAHKNPDACGTYEVSYEPITSLVTALSTSPPPTTVPRSRS